VVGALDRVFGIYSSVGEELFQQLLRKGRALTKEEIREVVISSLSRIDKSDSVDHLVYC